MVFHWNLSDSKCPQVSRTLLSILTDLNNAVVWVVSTRPLISKSSIPVINPSVTAQTVKITICSILLIWEFLAPALVDGLPLDSERLLSSLSIQDST